MLSSDFKEGETQTCHFKSMDKPGFQAYLRWAYEGEISTDCQEDYGDDGRYANVNFYLFAQTFLFPKSLIIRLFIAISEQFAAIYKTSGHIITGLIDAHTLKKALDETSSDSPVRQLFLDYLVHHMLTETTPSTDGILEDFLDAVFDTDESGKGDLIRIIGTMARSCYYTSKHAVPLKETMVALQKNPGKIEDLHRYQTEVLAIGNTDGEDTNGVLDAATKARRLREKQRRKTQKQETLQADIDAAESAREERAMSEPPASSDWESKVKVINVAMPQPSIPPVPWWCRRGKNRIRHRWAKESPSQVPWHYRPFDLNGNLRAGAIPYDQWLRQVKRGTQGWRDSGTPGEAPVHLGGQVAGGW